MNIPRLFHTIRYLKPIQIYGRLWFKLYQPKVDLSLAPARRAITGDWSGPCKKPVSLAAPFQFKFLNEVHDLRSVEDWNNLEWEKLWLYNLHYFDDLQAWDASSKKKLHSDLVDKWIRENPPGMGNGWEPYPSSLRIVNWIKWGLAGNSLSDEALHSLAVQARCLFKKLEYHLLGNHLFANAKALIFAGLFFDGPEAGSWLNKGLQILDKQVGEQILADGGHFELSPMYHSIILEDLLDLVNLMNTYGMEVPGIWLNSIPRMTYWLEGMCHPDGDISFFNDAALGIASTLKDLKAYSRRLGFVETALSRKGLSEFRESGYVRLENRGAVLIADVGKIGPDYLPGHAHADTLSFELSVQGQRIFVNSGISCYGNSQERLAQRGTESHNTMSLDHKNSSQVWSGFRVAKRAYPLGLEVEAMSDKSFRIRCGHDGYTRLAGKPVHWREWLLTQAVLEIKDCVTGGGLRGRASYYLYPGATVSIERKEISLDDIRIKFQTGDEIRVKDTFYYPEFGKAIANKCLVLESMSDVCSIKFIYRD